jgi:hypothetical protein
MVAYAAFWCKCLSADAVKIQVLLICRVSCR